MASDAMGEHLGKGLKKVTVAAPSKKGLEKGLEMAKGLMDSPMGEMMNKEEAPEHEEKESAEHEEAESPEYEAGEKEESSEEMGDEEHEALKELEAALETPEEVDAMIAELQKIKDKLSKKEEM